LGQDSKHLNNITTAGDLKLATTVTTRRIRRKRRRPPRKLNRQMRGKMMVLFGVILTALCVLIGRLMYIEYTNGSNYEKKVLSMQSYDSQTLPFQRGDIVDANGTVLATSVAVYNVILDCSVMTDK
jgi:stage V sporulation protein D (sporulation-specific penicillin-binding protein)